MAKKKAMAKRPSAGKKASIKLPPGVIIAARGLVDWINTRDGLEIRVYGTYAEAIGAGISEEARRGRFQRWNRRLFSGTMCQV